MSGRVLVTGSGGFIGGHLMDGARARGYRAVGLHRDQADRRPGEHLCLDLLDGAAEGDLAEAIGTVDAVIHAAAAVRMFGRPRDIVRENVTTTTRLLRAAARAGAPRIVFLSSASVLFAPRDQRGLAEDAPSPRRFLTGYAESKARCEALVADYPGESVVLRPQAVIGPGDRTLLPPILGAARSGRWAWIGEAGAAEVDLLSVDNLVEWALRAAFEPRAAGVFHLSDGEPRGVEGVLREVFERLGIVPGERRVPRAAALFAASMVEQPLRWLAPDREPPLTRFGVEVLSRTRTVDTSRARAVLGPPCVSFAEGLERMVCSHGSIDRRR